VADQEHRAVVFLEQVFQQLQRVDVEVVGGLVEHQHIRRTREQARQEQPVALAAGQRAHRGMRTRRREEEITEVALDVLAFAADLDPFAAGADEILQRGIEVQRIAHLVEIGHGDVGPLAHSAPGAVAGLGLGGMGRCRIGLELPQDQLEQGGLAGAIGPQQADLVTAKDRG
jgi:hypothetical protein